MRRLLRFLVVLAIGGVAVVAVMLCGMYRATQQSPEFYTAALEAPPQVQAEAGDELERRVLELRNELQQPGRWEAQFTQEQINGWLAADLPGKFPNLLPGGISDPRLALEPSLTKLACRYQDQRISTVVSLDADVYLTDEPNVVAVRLRQVRAGSLPIPLGQFLDQISRRAAEGGLALRWSEQEGDPLALLTIPPQIDERQKLLLHLDTIEVLAGQVRFAGRTEPLSAQDFRGQPASHQASGRKLDSRARQL